MNQTDVAAEVMAADVVARVDRAARSLAGRLARWGAEADDVSADVLGDMLADVAAGRPVDTGAAALAGRVRRAADTYRRRAERERPAGTAADVMGEAAAEADTGDADKRRRAAILARPATSRSMAADRADVLGVSDAARSAMRGADVQYLRETDRRAALAALADASWTPDRAAERAAWAALSAPEAAALYVTGRSVARYVMLAERPALARAERRAAMRAERRAAAARDRAAVRAALAADTGDAEAADAAAEAARQADAAWMAALSALEAAHGRPARMAAARQAEAAERPVPAGGAADALTAGYRPEVLAQYRTAARPRGALLSARRVAWADAAPEADAAGRAALGRAARRWAAHVSAAPAETWEADAWAAILRREAADAEADRVWVALSGAALPWRAEAAEAAAADADADRRAAARQAARLAWAEAAAERVAECVAGRPGRPGGFFAATSAAAVRREAEARAAGMAEAERRAAERAAAGLPPIREAEAAGGSMLAAHREILADMLRDAEVRATAAEAAARTLARAAREAAARQ